MAQESSSSFGVEDQISVEMKFSLNLMRIDTVRTLPNLILGPPRFMKLPPVLFSNIRAYFCRSVKEAQNEGKTRTAAGYARNAFGHSPILQAKMRTKTRHRQRTTPQNDTKLRFDALPWCADTFVLVSQNAHAHGSNVFGIGQ